MTVPQNLPPADLLSTAFEDGAVMRAMRQLDDYIKGNVKLALTEFDSLYTTPMYVGLEAEPKGILCVRIRRLPALEAVTSFDPMVGYVWDGARKRAKVDAIGGMLTGTGRTFRFTFLLVGY